MSDKGVIYILTNPSFPEYVKIGYADDINKRLVQLNRSECIPFAFRVYATYEVDSRLSDKKIHSIIDRLNPDLRSIDNFNGQKRVREFYAMTPEDAYSILEAIAEIHGFTDRLKKIEMNENEVQDEQLAQDIENEHSERASNFSFSACQIEIGIYVYADHISFINHNRPVPPVTIEAMNTDKEFRERNYLNPELKEMFFALDTD